MDNAMTDLAERLVAEFDTLPATTVIRVVTDCAEEWPDAEVNVIEDQARSRLNELSRSAR